MSTQAINKLRRKFILVATLSFAGAMFLIAGLIYVSNVLVTRREISNVIDYIIENEGELPSPSSLQDSSGQTAGHANSREQETGSDGSSHVSQEEWMEYSLSDLFGYRNWIYSSSEFLYSVRYFAVLFDESEEVSDIKTSHIAAVNDYEAEHYARIALDQPFRFGSFGLFYYKVGTLENGNAIVVYLDSTNQVTTNSRLLVVSLALIGLGIVIAFFLVRFFSYAVVRPEVEAAERQKRFITNASHELKTPLAVIRANTEVEQMVNGENEWNVSTMNQVDRMTGLIANMVMIAKAQEKESDLPPEKIDVSKAVSETAASFHSVAETNGKTIQTEIPDGISMVASEGDLRELATLLIDNAIKYCDDGGSVAVKLASIRKGGVQLAVSNSYAEGAGTDYSRFFDRFYRKDEAHNIESEGYGIGLSIAESLAEKYHGSLNASWKDGVITFTCILRHSA